MATNSEKEKTDKKLKLISKISEIADGMTLKYLEELNKTINDNDLTPKDGIKAFTEMDKVLLELLTFVGIGQKLYVRQ